MKKTVKLLALLLAAVLSTLLLTGCELDLTDGETEDPLTRAAESNTVITLPEGMDPEARFETVLQEGSMYIVFNGINKRDTEYFSVPGGSMTISAKATGEATGMKSFKINVWKKVEGGTQYVADSTIYYYTNDSMHSYTISGLDPAADYRLTLSYDAYNYYIYGQMLVEGAAERGAGAASVAA